MYMKRQLLLTALVIMFAGATRSRADAVLDWNAPFPHSAGRPGPSLTIEFAVVAAAVHDAVRAYPGRKRSGPPEANHVRAIANRGRRASPPLPCRGSVMCLLSSR